MQPAASRSCVLTCRTTGSSVRIEAKQRAGELVGAENRLLLRRGRRMRVSGESHSTSVGLIRLALVTMLAAGFAASVAVGVGAATTPSPDPSPSHVDSTPAGKTSSTPTPDPAPAAGRSSSPTASRPSTVAPAPAVSSSPSTSSSASGTPSTPDRSVADTVPPHPSSHVQRQRHQHAITPKPRPHVRAARHQKPARPPHAKAKTLAKTKAPLPRVAARAPSASAAAASGRPMLLGALALVMLVIASGGLLFVLIRPGNWRGA